MPKDLILQAWADDTGSFLAKQSMTILKHQAIKRGGKEGSDMIIASFLKSIVNEVITSSLIAKPEGIKTFEENVTFSQLNFARARVDIQNAVAQGITDAVYKFSETTLHYYCELKAVPEPISKEIN